MKIIHILFKYLAAAIVLSFSLNVAAQSLCDSSLLYNTLAYPSESTVTIKLRNGNVLIGGRSNDIPILVLADADYRPLKVISLTIDFQYKEGYVLALFEDNDGNFLVHALHQKTTSSRAMSIIQVREDLEEILWTRLLDDTDYDILYSTLEDPVSGNYIVAGGTSRNTAPGVGCDALLWLIDKQTGEILKSISANSGSCETWLKIVYFNGAYYATGRWDVRNTPANSGYRLALTKLDADLEIEWTKYYLADAAQDARCYANDLQVIDNKIFILGNGDLVGNSIIEIEAFLIEVDQDGQAKQIDYFNVDIHDREIPTQLGLNDQGFQIGGALEISGNFEGYILQLDQDRDFKWATGFTFDGADPNYFSSWTRIVNRYEFNSNETIIAGATFTDGTAYLSAAKINADGSYENNCLSGPPLTFAHRRETNPQTYSLNVQTYSKNRNVLSISTMIENLPLTLTRSCGVPDPQTETTQACRGEEVSITSQNGLAATITVNGSPLCSFCTSASFTATEDATVLFEYGNAACPLVDTLYLELISQDTSVVDVLVCDENSYTLPDGHIVTNNGVFLSTETSATGCLSIVQTTVVFNTSAIIDLTATYCQGGNVEIFGEVFDNPGDYVVVVSGNGCDANVNVQVTESQTYEFLSPIPSCQNNPVIFGGNSFFVGDTIVQSFISEEGCDSTQLSPIIAGTSFSESSVVEICDGNSYTFEGSTYDQSGTYTVNYMTIDGCDSTLILELSVAAEIFTSEVYTLCEGDTLILDGLLIMSDTTWQIESTSFTGCDSTHTITVSSQENPTVALVSSIGSCNGDSTGALIITESGASATTIRWMSGDVGNTRDQLTPGFYTAIATDLEGCSSTSTFEIEAASPAILDIETIPPTCLGDQDGSILIGPPGSVSNSSMADTSSISNEYSSLMTGSYQFRITDINGCSIDTVLFIEDGQTPPSIYHESPIILALGDSIRLRPTYDTANSILWQDSTGLITCDTCERPWVRPLSSVDFVVEVTDAKGCTSSAQLMLNVIAGPQLGVPTAFSPNGDGVNDRWQPKLPANVIRIEELLVFNRWGNLVFKQVGIPEDDPTFGWDGQYRNQPVNPDVFVFLVKYRLIDGTASIATGDLTLLR